MFYPTLACGPWFNVDEVGTVASLVMFLLIKPLAYFAFIQAFRYRVSRAIPMTRGQAVKLAALRMVMGVTLIGGGTVALMVLGLSRSDVPAIAYLYASRLLAWGVVGAWGARLRGRRLVGWTIFGTLLNVAFDGAAVGGLAVGWVYPVGITAAIAICIAVLDRVGRRPSLQTRFSTDPLCTQCQYNLTGNLSGVCPECGTSIA